MPYGGPDGGNGGRGGSVYIQADRGLFTLFHFKRKLHYKADSGQHGQGSNCFGKNADDLIIKVPPGTLVYDDNGELLADLLFDRDKVLVAKGGSGGKGNAYFKNSSNTAPRFSELGEPSVEKSIKLELKLIAEVGIIGFPNSGKSTLLSKISSARPRIADYAFTTIVPNLGVVELENKLKVTFADIPGLIEGASQGIGLGHRFLKHIQRTKLLIHMIDITSVDIDNPIKDYKTTNNELKNFSKELSLTRQIVAVNKTDLCEDKEIIELLKNEFNKIKIEPVFISAEKYTGLDELKKNVYSELIKLPKEPVILIKSREKKKEEGIKVSRKGRVFNVTGKILEKIISMTNWENDEALIYLQMRLKRLKVEEELEKEGIRDGDTVKIYNREFEYFKGLF